MWLEPKSLLEPSQSLTFYAHGGGTLSPSATLGPITHNRDEYYSRNEVMESTKGHHDEWHDCQHYLLTRNVTNQQWSYNSRYSPYDDDKWWINDVGGASHQVFWEGLSNIGYNAYGSWYHPLKGIPELYVDDGVHRGVVILGPAELGQLVSASLATMLPGLKPKLSIVNSIVELKDFKSLPHTLQKIRDLGKSLIKRGSWGRRSLRRIIGTTADSYLQSEFNIKPLLSDIVGVKSAIQTARKEIQDLLEGEGKPQTRHWSNRRRGATSVSVEKHEHTPVYTCDGNNSWANCSTSQATLQWFRDIYESDPLFHATIEYRYDLDPWERENAQLRGFLDLIGVNLNPTIIWNAIPWSFVVDWVVNVNSWLSQFQHRNLEPVTHIQRYMWSLKKTRKVIGKFRWDNASCFLNPSDPPDVTVVEVEEAAYIRLLDNPGLIRWFQTSGLSPKEFSLAAALGASRLK